MLKRLLLIPALLLLIAVSIHSDAVLRSTTALAQTRSIPAPADVLGFTPGDDRKLASWAKVVEYFKKLAAASDRVKFEEIGKSTMGAPFVYATISAPENLKRLNEYKEIQRQLADPRILGSPTNPALADRKARALIARGKTIIASNTIILLVPSTNPDGVDIVNNWYQKTLGTPYEGTDPPELYHKYTGHDDNRDWYAFTQVETQLVVDKILNVWHPQIVHDIHQQGAFGSRLFLPPYMQPVLSLMCRNRSSRATPNLAITSRKRCAPRASKALRLIRLTTPGRLRAPIRIITAACAFCRKQRHAVSPLQSPSSSNNFNRAKAMIRRKSQLTLARSGAAANGTFATLQIT